MTDPADADLIDRRAGRDVGFFDLYSIDQVSETDLDLILDLARGFRAWKTAKFTLNRGLSAVNVFFESSTRTISSFDLAEKHLSMDTNNVSATSSAVTKGETYYDTVMTLDAYKPRIISIRCAEAGVPEVLSRHVKASVISAGDGWHEHPTQGLLDALTMLDHFGSRDLKGRVLTIVGDIKHSRVFGSLVRVARRLGAEVRVAAPKTMLPEQVEQFGLTTHFKVEEALDGAHVVYALRVQEERGANGFIPTLREYSKMFGITRRRMDLTAKDAILMHPGPVRRDIDIHSALVTLDEQSHILRQAENGMAVRKALLWLLANRMDDRVKQAVTI